MAVQTSAGSKIYIGTTSSDEEHDSYVEVGEVTNIPEFGRAYEEVTFASLGNRAVQKFKGTYNDGTITVQLGRDVSDVGQAAIQAALDDDFDYNFKVTLNDASAVSGSHPTIIYFKAKVMSYTTNIGAPNQVVQASAQLGIKSGSIYEIEAT